MTNLVSARISNKIKFEFEIKHDFRDSHGRKISDEPNFIINFDGSVTEFHRDTDCKIDIKDIASKRAASIELAQMDYKKNHPRAMKSNTNLHYSGVITFGNNDGVLSKSEVNSKDQFLLDANALSFVNEFAFKNGLDKSSIYLVKHNDEAMTHYHFSFVAFDHNKHEVMRNRMTPQFMMELQDLAGTCFKPSGFDRGIRKNDRIEKVLLDRGLTRSDYNAMMPADKLIILKEANVKNKSPKKLHCELKNDLFSLQQSLDKSLNLFELVENSTPDQLQSIKESIDNSGDRLVSRFFVYAQRLHNERADKEKAIKNLVATIEKLGSQKEELEADFRKYAASRFAMVTPIPIGDLGIKPKNGDKKALLGKIILSENDYDDLRFYVDELEDRCRFFYNQYNEQANILAPLSPHVNELKDLVYLKETVAKLQIQKNNLESDVKIIRSAKEKNDLAQHQLELKDLEFQRHKLSDDVSRFQKEMAKIENRLAEIKKMSIELVKNPSPSSKEEIKTEARRLEIVDIKQLEYSIDNSGHGMS